ncbi:MAG: 2-amino-4-hydroxy-6-hydroxymethyldihydropteridine diphosphokinase, partial [Bacteroidetes bacterium]|nr:2-amino-4-hydroxy-6-hydroxymethyldihydropteridine diphosphokinase [Bacteroidota bacterium]
METKVVLGIGGNKGDRESYLSQAVEALSKQVTFVSCSQVYESEAWGGVAQLGNFLNQVLLIQTSLDPLTLLQVTQQIEIDLGRTREEHWGDRTIDIDILYFGELVCHDPQLILPHPYIAERRFVLQPLAEILPLKKHPVSGKTSVELLAACSDLGKVFV